MDWIAWPPALCQNLGIELTRFIDGWSFQSSSKGAKFICFYENVYPFWLNPVLSRNTTRWQAHPKAESTHQG